MNASAIVGRHALVKDEVFTIVKGCPYDFPLIHKRPDPIPAFIFFKFTPLRTVDWIRNEHPYMMLIPTHKPFYYPLFDRLDVEEFNVPVKRTEDNAWVLEPNLVTRWVSLERNLRAMLYAMLELCGGALPRLFQFWAFPKRCGYESQYSCCRHAQIIAIRSRDAFVPLIAAVTLMLLLLRERELLIKDFRWRDKVLSKTQIHPQWLAALESSAAGDFSLQRVGGIIDLKTCEFRGILHLITELPLDLYLCWGIYEDRPTHLHPFVAPLLPSPDEVRELSVVSVSRRHISKTHDPRDSTPLPPNNTMLLSKSYPPVEKYSGQKVGEDLHAFFARREDADLLKASREPPQQHQSRMQRLENAAKGAVPGRKGARVYVWENVDGFRVRKAVCRGDCESVWYDYGPKQRKYDSFRDEWDLCSEFDPSDAPCYDDESDNDNNSVVDGEASGEEGNDTAPPFILLPDDTSLDHNEGHYSSTVDLQRVLVRHSVYNYDTFNFMDTIEDRVYYRFGFHSIGIVAPPAKQIKWRMAREMLGNGRWSEYLQLYGVDPSAKDQDAICNFFGYVSASNNISDMPVELYDLCHPDTHLQALFTKVRLRYAVLQGKTYQLIRPVRCENVEDAQFELGLTSAATTLEILRHEWGPDLISIAKQLLDRGIPFNLFIHASIGKPTCHFLPRYAGLGYRSSNYRPDVVDYEAYEVERNRFLMSARGRAALLAGGLIARLARDVVSYEDVFYGPSDGFEQHGFCLSDEKHPDFALWDDCLTEDEQDLICGVYRIDTGKSFTEN